MCMEILTLCQKETTPKLLKMSENQIGCDKKDSTNAISNQSEKERETPTIPIGRVYLITNLINGKRYVGITSRSLRLRWNGHVSNTKSKNVSVLKKAIIKYGKENFSIELLEELFNVTERELQLRETFYIDKCNTFIDGGKGYNLIKQSDSKLVVSEETRKKLSHKGENNGMYGKHLSDNAKKARSEWVKAHQTGANHPMYGKLHTEESKNKMRKNAHIMCNVKNPRFDSTIRNFKNILQNISYSGTQSDFKRFCNLNAGDISRLCRGQLKTLKGWSLITEA